MGNQNQKWTAYQEEALKAGVNKHGTGKRTNIPKDPKPTSRLCIKRKVGNNCAALRKRTPLSKQRDDQASTSQKSGQAISTETVEDASKTASYKIAYAENKRFEASVAIGEAERVLSMAEVMEAIEQLIKAINNECLRDEIVLQA